MQLTHRFMICNIIGLFAFCVSGFVAYTNTKNVGKEFHNISSQTIPVVGLLHSLKSDVLRIVSSTNESLFLQSIRGGQNTPGEAGAAIQAERSLSQDGEKALMANLESYSHFSNSYFPGQSGSAGEVTQLSNSLVLHANGLRALMDKGAEAGELLEAKEQLEAAESAVLGVLEKAIKTLESEIAVREKTVQQTIQRSGEQTLSIIALGFFLMLAISTLLSRSILRRIRKLEHGLDEVARGNFVQVDDQQSGDELGSLGTAFANMAKMIEQSNNTQMKAEADLKSLNNELEQKVAERTADVQAARAEAEAASLAKSVFLANMSHEIRTPMNGVFGMTDLLMRTPLTDRQRRLLGTVNQSAKTLLTIINDILDVSRIESGKMDLDNADVDLKHCLEGSVMLFGDQAENKDLELTLFVAEDVPNLVKGDAGRLRQICVNLIGNAVKFTLAGEVSVRVTNCLDSDGAQCIKIAVSDTGIGMTAETLGRIFKPFAQGDSSISRRFGGTGLGLVITQQLTQLMKGTLAIESEAGEGTTISCTLPLPAVQGAARPRRVNIGRLVGQRILVVDDRETNREIVSNYLMSADAEVLTASNANDAMRMLVEAYKEKRPFAAMVSDVMMPGSDGLDLAQRVQEEAKLADLRIILLTSMNWKGDAAAARKLGVSALLTKPIRREELLDTLSRALVCDTALVEAAPRDFVKRPELRFAGHILLAEDNPVNIEVAIEYLKSYGCTYVLARDGLEAVSAFRTGTFDLILMDVQMPRLDGVTATGQIRDIAEAKKQPRTPIVAVTANAFEADRKVCLAADMDGFLCKPFTEQQLEKVLSKWLAVKPAAKQPAAKRKSKVVAPKAAEKVAPLVKPKKPRAGAKNKQAEAGTPAQAMPPAAANCLDRVMLDQMQSGHPVLFGRMIETFLSYAPEMLDKLAVAAACADRDALRATAHSLKSSSANVGASKVTELCRQLEHIIRSNPLADATACSTLACGIDRELKAALIELATLRSVLAAVSPVATAAQAPIAVPAPAPPAKARAGKKR